MNYILLSFALLLSPKDSILDYPDEVLSFIIKHSDESYINESKCSFVIQRTYGTQMPKIKHRVGDSSRNRYKDGYSFCFYTEEWLYGDGYTKHITIDKLTVKKGVTEYKINWVPDLREKPEKTKRLKLKQ